jgi:hypothetical protein
MTTSFLRFTLGFLMFVGVSLAVTLAIDKYAASQDGAQAASVSSGALGW